MGNLRKGTDENAEDVVGGAEPCYGVGVVEKVALKFLRMAEDWKWKGWRFWTR